MKPGFDSCNIYRAPAEYTRAHGGDGLIRFARLLQRDDIEGPCNFVDYTVVPPGVCIGSHTHATDEEEYYLILRGEGELVRNGESRAVREGDLVRNRPGDTHSLSNNGADELHLFVFELSLNR